MRTWSWDVVTWGEGKLCPSTAKPTFLGTDQLCCPCPRHGGWDCSHPPAQPPPMLVPGNVTVSSGQTQAHPSCFSSPATVIDLSMSMSCGCFRTSLLLFATRASPQLAFLRDALTLNALFPGQPVKCLLFMAMPKILVNIYEPICHSFFYDGKKKSFSFN